MSERLSPYPLTSFPGSPSTYKSEPPPEAENFCGTCGVPLGAPNMAAHSHAKPDESPFRGDAPQPGAGSGFRFKR